MRPWLVTRFILPFVPFTFDLFVRWVLLKTQLQWWQLPDLKTFSITTAFFCLLMAMDVNGVSGLPSDADYRADLTAIRRRFGCFSVVSVITFGCATGVEASERKLGVEDISTDLFPWLVSLTIVMLIISLADAVITNLKFKLSYAA